MLHADTRRIIHESTFEYLKPTDSQLAAMARVRTEAAIFADLLQTVLPDGPDKTYTLRKLREVAMWANVALTRHPDGSPRVDDPLAEYPADHPAPGDLGSVPM